MDRHVREGGVNKGKSIVFEEDYEVQAVRPRDKFQRHDSVIHVKTGHVYMILLSPCSGLRLEASGEPAYLYQRFGECEDRSLWVRSAIEMEDGRFEFKHRST